MTAATKQLNVPALRFPGFEGEWKGNKLKDILKINQGLQIPVSERFTEQVEGGHFYITNEFLRVGSQKKYYIKNPSASVLCTEEDLLMTRTGNTGMVVTGVSGAFHNNFFKIKYNKEEVDKWFLYYFLTSHSTQFLILKLAGASTIPDLNHGDFYKISINLPSLVEQQKTASFLTAVDTKIQQLTQKQALLEEYKKGVMQQLFSQQIRFKDENGQDFPEWQVKKFGEIFHRVKRKNAENNKNVLTISAQNGLISQEEYFNKSVSSENVTGYYLLHKGDFAYNKSYSKGYPMGAIKRLTRYDKGVVSPLYICFKTKDENLEEYYEQYFESGFLNRELQKIAQEGARNHGLLNMSVVEFFDSMKLPRPSIAEQTKIADFLTAIDAKVALVAKQLHHARQFKKGLLQQLFV